jgi:hypothetical protein
MRGRIKAMSDDPPDDELDPATVLMYRLAQDPRMAGVPMYVTYEDGSTLSIEAEGTNR